MVARQVWAASSMMLTCHTGLPSGGANQQVQCFANGTVAVDDEFGQVAFGARAHEVRCLPGEGSSSALIRSCAASAHRARHWPRLLVYHGLRKLNVFGVRGLRMLHHRDCVPVFREDVGDRIPAGVIANAPCTRTTFLTPVGGAATTF